VIVFLLHFTLWSETCVCACVCLWRGLFQFSSSSRTWDAGECNPWPQCAWWTILAAAGNNVFIEFISLSSFCMLDIRTFIRHKDRQYKI